MKYCVFFSFYENRQILLEHCVCIPQFILIQENTSKVSDKYKSYDTNKLIDYIVAYSAGTAECTDNNSGFAIKTADGAAPVIQSFGRYGVHLSHHRSQVHSGPEW